jgi:hypothetical protein
MDSARAKLRRANVHLGSLNRVLRRFAIRDPYRIGFRTIREGKTRYAIAIVDGWEPLPPSIPLIVGDVCTNLQAALDHLLWQCRIDANPEFAGTVSFPVEESPELFQTNSHNDIKDLPAEQRELIEQAQPFNRGNDRLPILQEMDRIDKQRLVSVATATEEMEKVHLVGYQTAPEYETMDFDIRPDIQIEKGAELQRFSLDNLETTGDGHPADALHFQFRFNQPESIAGHDVITTLREVRDEVQWVIAQFEAIS